MAQSLHLASRAWAVGQTTQDITNLNPNSSGFDFRMGFTSWPAGDCVRLQVLLSTDGATFNPWIDQTFNGSGVNLDGTPRTSVRLSATWPGVNGGSGGRHAIKGTDVRFILDILQPITASLDVVPT